MTDAQPTETRIAALEAKVATLTEALESVAAWPVMKGNAIMASREYSLAGQPETREMLSRLDA
jgi:hypothetical protein